MVSRRKEHPCAAVGLAGAVRRRASGAAPSAGCRRGGSTRPRRGRRSERSRGTAVSVPSSRAGDDVDLLPRRDAAGQPGDGERLGSGEAERRRVLARRGTGAAGRPSRRGCSRWIRSKLSASTARTPSSAGPFAAQSRRGAAAVLLAGEHDQRHALVAVAHRRRRRSCSHARRSAGGSSTGPRCRARARSSSRSVRERAAHHHLVVPAARAVAVEVALLDAVLEQVPAGRRVRLDRARRRDVVRRDRVPHLHEARARRRCRSTAAGCARQALEERRLLHVRRGRDPTRTSGPRATAARSSARRRRRSGRTRA